MVHLNGSALPNLIEDKNATSSSNLFEDLHHLNTLHDHRDHNRSGRHERENIEPISVQRPASAPRRSRPAGTARGPRPLLPRSLKEALQLAELLSKSKLIPKGFETPETCLVGILYGMEVGLSPIAALQRMAVIDGRPTIWGDAALALVQSSGLLQSIREEIIEDAQTKIMTAICRVEREGRSEPVTGTFSVEDAKRAGLWQKPGPWTDYPKRMLTMRARAFALRDAFPDVLAGLYIREEFEGAKITPSNSIERQTMAADEEWSQAFEEHLPCVRGRFNTPKTHDRDITYGYVSENSRSTSPNIDPRHVAETGTSKVLPKVRRAPPPPEEVGDADTRVEFCSTAERFQSEQSHSDVNEPVFLDPEIILDLFDSALCCALDIPTLEEIIDEFAERLRQLPRDAQERAQRIIERHHKRVEDLDRSTATDHSASDGASKADHNRPDPEVDQHEAGSDAEFGASQDAATLPRGLKPFLSNLGLGRMPVMRRRRKSRDARLQSLASWNARTQLSNLNDPLRDEDVPFIDPMETEE